MERGHAYGFWSTGKAYQYGYILNCKLGRKMLSSTSLRENSFLP